MIYMLDLLVYGMSSSSDRKELWEKLEVAHSLSNSNDMIG